MQAQKFQNILNQQIQPTSCMNNRAKMTFLQGQKERLQVQIAELIQNNDLLRKVNKELTKNLTQASNRELIARLTQQNQLLQKSYLRILRENQFLSSSLLMSQQIFDQHVLQHQNFTKDYQEKIIQLRRSIQMKQASIQQLEKRVKSEESIVTQPTNVTLLFFNEIDQLKKIIEHLSVKNNHLEQENVAFKNKLQGLQKRLQLLEALTTKSKIVYDQFKLYYNSADQIRKSSAPKKGTCIPFRFQSKSPNKKLNEGQSCVETREYTEYISRVDTPAKMLIYKLTLQVLDLKEKYKTAKNKLKVEQQLRQKALVSNTQLNKALASLISQSNYYKKSTQDLMQLLSNKSCKSRSVQKLKREKYLSQIKNPSEIVYITERKKYWVDMQQSVKIDRFKLLHVKNKYKKMKRSLSCFVDYRRSQVDQIEKYMNKQVAMGASKNNKMQQLPVETFSDFSQFIDELGNADISIIQGSEKGKTSYSEWKKATKTKSILNLTILEENIL